MSGAERAGGAGVTVRYWAALRAAAGTASDQVPAGRLSEVLASVSARHADGPRFAQVLRICSVLVDERPVTQDPGGVEVPPDSVVDLLPPFAGG